MDISDIVDSSDNEEGLLGMAFHPNWESNGYFYLFYTTETTIDDQFGRYDRLARFQIDPKNPFQALSESELPLLSQWDQQWNHNGGDLHFGPDDYLYVSLGDEGEANDQFENSRFIDRDFYSAIMRIDVDRGLGSLEPNDHVAIHLDAQNQVLYAIPPDNPFIGATEFNGKPIDANSARMEFGAVGLRNPWRFSFDSATNLLYCADVGQNSYEEVDIITKGGDYGWRLREGLHAFRNNVVPDGVSLIDPVLEYPQNSGPNIPGGRAEGKSITGGVVYNGNRFAQLNGFYVFADYVSNRLFMFRYNPQTGEAEAFQQIATVSSPVSFGIDPSNGDVLIVRLNGRVDRLIYSDTPISGEPLPGMLS